MQLVVLGSGTCVPSGLRSSSGYWIEQGDVRLRLDCGSGTVHAMARYGLDWEALSHQFISHFHIDHVGELPALLFALKYGRAGRVRSQPLQLLGPVGLQGLMDGWESLFRQRLLQQQFPIEVQELAPDTEQILGEGLRLRVTKAPHNLESLAVRIEGPSGSIGFTGDTARSAELAVFFQGVDVLIAECSFLQDDHKTAHLSAEDTARLAQDAGAAHLVATHCYFDPEAQGLAQRLADFYTGRITLAADGLRLSVGA